MNTELSPRYDASSVEAKWYERWEAAGLFQPDPDSKKPPFTITIPPPNITGSLHMGHSLCYPIQDLVGRYQRLRGKNVLVLPGQDHAGIATQSVVSKQLKKEGVSSLQLGREKFVERVWEWRKESGDTIIRQFRQLGCAFDWSRSRFTLDPQYADAVLKVFIDWFDKGLIYRGERVVNWDCSLQTSVSDIETERKTVRGKLYHIRYPLSDGPGSMTIATTRPETMLGDVALAVHPSDQRYKALVGKTVLLPLLDRPIPVVADVYADPQFGTGVVKITPAHDPNDFEVGVRHHLSMPVILDERGKITSLGGKYEGLDRMEARKQIVGDLEALGLLEKVEDHEIALIVSERSGEVVEPLLKEQWFVRQMELAKPVIEAVREGKIRFVPERYEPIFIDWLENIRDWNISRKLWWGHRIPVYYAEDGSPVAALSWEDAERKSGKTILAQDEEVLDTWFSSGLWPFATLGWPDQTRDLGERYPTNVLVTDRNIINLWVARMAMMGIYFIGDVPFHEVYIHATVMTEDGRRMSKSLGTGVDPADVIERIGADALRFTLLGQSGFNQEIRYGERRTDEARNFCNKIWNATRFVLMNTPEGYRHEGVGTTKLEPLDLWILSRLAHCERVARVAYDSYNMQAAAQALQAFFWWELCDWYVEASKERLVQSSAAPLAVLIECIRCFCLMLHPIMPHLTEEIFSHLPLAERPAFVMSGEWPELPEAYVNQKLETSVERWFQITRGLRALRAAVGVAALAPIEEAFFTGDLMGGQDLISSQAWVRTLREGRPQSGKFISSTVEGVDLHLPIEGLVDFEKERERLRLMEEKVRADLAKVEARLGNPQFIERAKMEVVAKEQELVLSLRDQLDKLAERKSLFNQ